MKVVVLGGGRSSEHEVSLVSAGAVAAGLREAGHEVHQIEIGKDGVWQHGKEEVELKAGRGLLDCEVAFPVLHGPYGEDGTIQGMLEHLNIAYVGAGVHSSALCMDKGVFKGRMKFEGIPQVDYEVLREAPDAKASQALIDRLGLPLFVKPARLGSSVGISRVDTSDDFDAALKEAFEHDSAVLLEASADGREIECGVLGISDLTISEPGEILVKGGGWYDYEAKYTEGAAEVVIPAKLDASVVKQVKALAEKVFRLAGCSGMARVDFFVTDNDVLVSETNTIPGFTPTSAYPRLMETAGVSFTQLLNQLLDEAAEEHRRYLAREH